MTGRPVGDKAYWPLAIGGEMARAISEFEWGSSPLGEPDTWSPELRSAVRTMLASKFPVAVAWGPEYLLLYNDGYRPILGQSKHPHALGAPTAEIFPEIWDEVVRPLFDRAYQDGEATFAEDLLLPLDRFGFLEECYFTFCYSAIPDDDGRPVGVLVTVVETSDRVLAEKRLALLHELAEDTGEIGSTDDAYHRLAAVLQGQADVVPFAQLWSPSGPVMSTGVAEAVPELMAAAARVSASAQPEAVDGLDLSLPEPFPGAERPSSALVVPLASPAGGTVVVGLNPAQRLDAPYRRFVDLVSHHMASALNRARALEEERARVAAFAELDRAKTEFFANVSHEFRTPLTLLLAPLEDLLEDRTGLVERNAERLEVAYRNALRLLKLVDGLLDFARLQAGRLEACFEPVDLSAYSAELVSMFETVIERAELQLVVDAPPLPEPVYIDRDLWEGVVFNIMSNAVKFTTTGSITVTVRADGPEVEFCVTDTGVGVGEEEIPRLFERFHRAPDAEGRSREGAGIGLSLVSEVAALHGGRVSVESRLGQGSAFRVRVPFGRDHLDSARIGARPPVDRRPRARPYVEEALRWVAPDADRGSDRSGRVLVVDDNADMRSYVVQLLGEHWSVDAVGDPRVALDRMRAEPPDVAVVDVMLPGVDGFDLSRQIRDDPRTRHVRIVMVSARAGSEAAADGLLAGADDYLVKPFASGELVARVNVQMQIARSQRELRARSALLAAQLEAAPQAILAISPDRKVIACNRKFEALWGLPPGSVTVGARSPALMSESLVQVRDPEAFEAALRWGHEHPHELQQLGVPLKDGRVIEGVSAPVVDDSGNYHGRIWFLSDDSMRRRVEADRTALLERIATAQRSQSFLLAAAQALARASGYTETLQALASVAVPTLGDICLIDVLDDTGLPRRVAGRHADPTRQPLVDQLLRGYPPDPKGLHPVIDAIRTRRSRWSDNMSDEFLRATTQDEEHYRLTRQLGFTSYMTVPLIHEDDVLGAVTLVSAGSGRRLGPDDLSLAEDLASQVAAVAAKARRHEQDQQAAHALQATLLPSALPDLKDVSLAVRYLAANTGAEVGGDWYDAVFLGSGCLWLAVGDVAGHDMEAAAAMGALRMATRALLRDDRTPAELLRLLQSSWDILGIDRFATCVIGRLDPASGELMVATAGHPPPLVVGRADAHYLPVEPAAPLGGPDTPVRDYTCTLSTDSLLLLYTDGLVEERSRSIQDGLDLLRTAALEGPRQPDQACDWLLAELAAKRSDDIALLAVARRAHGAPTVRATKR